MKISTLPQLYRNLNRWREILSILSKYGLADWISRVDLELLKGIFRDPAGEELARLKRETRIRLAIVELGPTFIKLGQILSTRPDLVGLELAAELQQLQANVAPDPPEVAEATIVSELGRSISEVFAEYERSPIASASIGQVHRARLADGRRVVIKVQKAGLSERINVDLEILGALAQIAERIPEFVNYRPVATAGEFARMLRRELDYGREQRYLRQFAQMFEAEPTICIPAVYPELSTSRVLTMQELHGVRLSDRQGLAAGGFDLEEVARRGADLYLQMIFDHGLYHADPHPGNLTLLDDNVIGLMDFGMVGRLDERLRETVEEMFLAVTKLDAEYLTALIVRLGSPPADLDRAALGLDLADFVSFYGSQDLSKFDLSGALDEMTEIIRRYRIMLPARAGMLIKVLVMLEGAGRLLSPRFNLLEVMRPHRRKLMRRHLSPVRRWRKVKRLITEFEYLAEIAPRRIGDILAQMHNGKFDVHLDHRGLEPSVNRLVLGMVTSSLILSSALLLTRSVPPLVWDVSVWGIAAALGSAVLALRLLLAIIKSGNLDRRR